MIPGGNAIYSGHFSAWADATLKTNIYPKGAGKVSDLGEVDKFSCWWHKSWNPPLLLFVCDLFFILLFTWVLCMLISVFWMFFEHRMRKNTVVFSCIVLLNGLTWWSMLSCQDSAIDFMPRGTSPSSWQTNKGTWRGSFSLNGLNWSRMTWAPSRPNQLPQTFWIWLIKGEDCFFSRTVCKNVVPICSPNGG